MGATEIYCGRSEHGAEVPTRGLIWFSETPSGLLAGAEKAGQVAPRAWTRLVWGGATIGRGRAGVRIRPTVKEEQTGPGSANQTLPGTVLPHLFRCRSEP